MVKKYQEKSRSFGISLSFFEAWSCYVCKFRLVFNFLERTPELSLKNESYVARQTGKRGIPNRRNIRRDTEEKCGAGGKWQQAHKAKAGSKVIGS